MSSTVGPAVTSTVSPSRSWRRARTAIAASTISSGSARRPLPSHPQARYPLPGSTTKTPWARRVARFSWTAGCSYMLTFMAGATSTGAFVARYSVLSASSAMPRANLPRMLAVAGATSSRSASSAIETWRMSPFAPGAHWSWKTGWRERASNVIGATKRVAAAVITTRTSAPRRCSSRSTSQALYAPMHPVTPRTTTGTELLLGGFLGAGLGLLADLPRDRLRDRLLDRDAGGLPAAGVDPRLRPGLQLLRPLRRDRDEPELRVHVLGKDQLAHAV